MNDVEKMVKDVLSEMESDGTIKKIIRGKIENAFRDSITDAFVYGNLRSKIREKIDEKLVPHIEHYDMDKYIPTLDSILTEIVNTTSLTENKKILENFRELMIEPKEKTVSFETIFDRYKKFISLNADTYEREVVFDEKPQYKPVYVKSEITELDGYKWSSFQYLSVELSAGEDEDEEDENKSLNVSFTLRKWKDDKKDEYKVRYDTCHCLDSIGYLSDFECFLLQLERADVSVKELRRYLDDYVTLQEEPELTYR